MSTRQNGFTLVELLIVAGAQVVPIAWICCGGKERHYAFGADASGGLQVLKPKCTRLKVVEIPGSLCYYSASKVV